MVLSGRTSFYDLQEAMKALQEKQQQMGQTHGKTTNLRDGDIRPSDQPLANNDSHCQADR